MAATSHKTRFRVDTEKRVLYHATSLAKHAMDSPCRTIPALSNAHKFTERNSQNMAAIAPTWQQSHKVRRPWQVWSQNNSVDDIAVLFFPWHSYQRVA